MNEVVSDRLVCYKQTNQSGTRKSEGEDMEPSRHATLPQLSGRPMVTDGGLETDLIYHHDVDLPDFAAFPLVDSDQGRQLLLRYYREYVDIAKRAGAGLQLET